VSILPDHPSRLFKTVDRNKHSRTNNYPPSHPHCYARTTHATKFPATKETSTSQIQLLNVERDTPGEAQLKQCSSLVLGQVVARVGRAQCVEGRIEPAHRHEVQQSLATKGTKSSPKCVTTVKWSACGCGCTFVLISQVECMRPSSYLPRLLSSFGSLKVGSHKFTFG